MTEKILDLVNKFFSLLWVQIDSLSVKNEDEKRNIFFIDLQTPDSKLIIWIHGQTLENIKHLLSRMIENIVGDRCTVHIEINDYMKSKDDKLFRYIDGRIDYVMKNNKEIKLPNFSSYERKKIHNYLSEKNIDWLTAHSEWVWADRVMHLSYSKTKKDIMDLDLDWIDI